ncbi:hypothetical protein [Polaribacter sp. R2A056_3_33]
MVRLNTDKGIIDKKVLF